MTEETITLIPPGKLQCIVTGKLRPETPEEHVRQRIARSLLEDYGYDKADVEIEFTVNLGSSKKRVDIAIFPPRVEHKQENIKIIVECKPENIRPTDRDNGVEQLKSYLSACANAHFGMWIGAELQVWERLVSDKGEVYFAGAPSARPLQEAIPRGMRFRQLHSRAGFLHHSDQGSQYTSNTYLDCLNAALADLSMSGAGNCYDNAVMESFFSTPKTECVTDVFASWAEAHITIFEFLEVWYNRQRLHSTLGYLSLVEFESKFSH